MGIEAEVDQHGQGSKKSKRGIIVELKIYKNHHEQSVAAAEMIINCIKIKPNALLCFATGDSPKLTYQFLVEKIKRDKIDFSKCFMIGLDEWMGIPPDNTGSCHYFLHQYLFRPMNITSSQIHLFNAFATNEIKECETMNELIIEKGGIDLMVVGVGMNGHIGFNEPGADINSLAHVATLDEITRTVGQKYFQDKVTISKGITLGLKQIMQAKTLLMLADGEKKALVIKKATEQNVSTDFPASLIREHGNGFLIIDNEAALELKTQLQ